MSGNGYSVRAAIAGGLLAVAGLILALAVYSYVRESRLSAVLDPARSTQAEAKGKELASLFQRPPLPETRFQIIEERNLFSPERKAFHPPPPPETPPPPPPPSAPRGDVTLYGTSVNDDDKYAILSFSQLPSGERRKHLLRMGETVEDKEKKSGISFTVVDIAADKVTLKDHTGAVFDATLFDGKRKRGGGGAGGAAVATPIPPPAAESQPTVVIQNAPPKTPPKTAAPAAANRPLTRESINAMPEAEKERLVNEGKLRKIQTPMGNAYKPAQ